MNRLSMKNQDVKYVEHFLNSMSRFDGTNIAKQLKKCEAYEDTGLEPEQIPEMSQMFREKCEEVNRYEKLKEQGRLIELPCKVGDTIYLVDFEAKGIDESEVLSIEIEAGNSVNITSDYLERMDISAFGLYAFATREEAEKALAANEQNAKQE